MLDQSRFRYWNRKIKIPKYSFFFEQSKTEEKLGKSHQCRLKKNDKSNPICDVPTRTNFDKDFVEPVNFHSTLRDNIDCSFVRLLSSRYSSCFYHQNTLYIGLEVIFTTETCRLISKMQFQVRVTFQVIVLSN